MINTKFLSRNKHRTLVKISDNHSVHTVEKIFGLKVQCTHKELSIKILSFNAINIYLPNINDIIFHNFCTVYKFLK